MTGFWATNKDWHYYDNKCINKLFCFASNRGHNTHQQTRDALLPSMKWNPILILMVVWLFSSHPGQQLDGYGLRCGASNIEIFCLWSTQMPC